MKTVTAQEFITLLADTNYIRLENYKVEGPFAFPNSVESQVKVIKNVLFLDMVIIEKVEHNDYTFKGCIFHSYFEIENSTISSLILIDCTFREDVNIRDSNIINFRTENSTIEKVLALRKLNVRQFRIFGSANNIQIIGCNIDTLWMLKLSENCDIRIVDRVFSDIPVADSTIKKVILNLNQGLTGSIVVRKTKINELTISGTNNDSGRLVISDVVVSNIYILNFKNNGYIRTQNINVTQEDSSLKLHNTTLGFAELINIDFGTFKQFTIHKSFIEKIVCSNIKWCNGNAKRLHNMSDLDQREVYRQLKNVMISSNNKFEELNFFSMEMVAHTNYLLKQKGHFGDKFILLLNGFTNKHGLSWSRAFTIILSITAVFYVVIKMVLGYTTFSSQYILHDIVNSIEFINPVHKFTDVFTSNKLNGPSSDLAKLLDVIYRILISYMLYQFLVAFRKYGKK